MEKQYGTIKRRKNGGYLIIEVLSSFKDVNDGDMLVRLGKDNRVLKCYRGIGVYRVGKVLWEHNIKDKYDYIFKQFITPEGAIKYVDKERIDGDIKVYSFDVKPGTNHPHVNNVITVKKNGNKLKLKPLIYIFGYGDLIPGDTYVYTTANHKVLDITDTVNKKRIALVLEDYGVNNKEKIFNTFTHEMNEMPATKLIELVCKQKK
jgi:hypothetical protein